jgi:hypothetical protein
MAQMPKHVVHFLKFEANMPIGVANVFEYYQENWRRGITWDGILRDMRRFSRDFHIESYNGMRPEDGVPDRRRDS